MKSSSTSASNALILSGREWIIAIVLTALVTGTIYFGWGSWERYNPGPDHRETCWAELQSDYWAYMRWMKTAKERYDILLLGDSVVWGQEVPNDETISHFINEELGSPRVANMGNDGLHLAGIHGAVQHYGDHLGDTNIILQCSPLWMTSPKRDLRGEKKARYHHPRLIPQFDSRINYYHDLNTRLGYLSEHSFRVFPFVRHLMANYFDNKSISSWMMDHPYKNPFSEVTFQAASVMAESQGKGLDWATKGMKESNEPFIDPETSIQFGLYLDALDLLEKKNANVFVMIGPYNQYYHSAESREKLFEMIGKMKAIFDKRGIPYYDTFTAEILSDTFADSCHLLPDGHKVVARELVMDAGFQSWLGNIK